MEDLARQAEEASGRGNAKELYSITRKRAGDKNIPDRPVRDKSGELLTDQEEQQKGGHIISKNYSKYLHQARCPT